MLKSSRELVNTSSYLIKSGMMIDMESLNQSHSREMRTNSLKALETGQILMKRRVKRDS